MAIRVTLCGAAKMVTGSCFLLILTHSHVDHCGRIPLLAKEGFRGKILCTKPTAQIARIMLLDAVKVMHETYKSRLKKAERVIGMRDTSSGPLSWNSR